VLLAVFASSLRRYYSWLTAEVFVTVCSEFFQMQDYLVGSTLPALAIVVVLVLPKLLQRSCLLVITVAKCFSL
jgi:hypothetical protein